MSYTRPMRSVIWSVICFVLVIALTGGSHAASFEESDIPAILREVAGLPMGQRIAYWAERFVGTPYDPDPLGEYVTKRAIIADERVDCMYLTFRSVELALSGSPEEAVDVALDKRFFEHGVLKDGKVVNYDGRYQYAMDMLRSGKWGSVVTAELGPTVSVPGSRGVDKVDVIGGSSVPEVLHNLQSGDIVFFVKDEGKRVVGEIIGHIGIVKREGNNVFLIHASGRKNGGGAVVKVPLAEYAYSMPFVGIIVSRF